MSKKPNKTNQTRKPVKTAPRSASTGKPTGGKPMNGKPVSVKGRAPAKAAEPQVNLMAVRIVASVVAALCLVGVIVAFALGNIKADVATIIEMVLLGILVGFSVLAAVKPAMVAEWAGRLGNK